MVLCLLVGWVVAYFSMVTLSETTCMLLLIASRLDFTWPSSEFSRLVVLKTKLSIKLWLLL